MTYSKESRALRDAKQRCNNPNHPRYKDWGGRGIQVKFHSLQEFLNEVGKAPEGSSIDRIDNDGHYEKGNVKWSSRSEQQHNKRMYKQNKTGVTGVREIKSKGSVNSTWQAYITVDGVFKQLYAGPSYIDACEARKAFGNPRYE